MISRVWVTNSGTERRPLYSLSFRSEDGLSFDHPMELPPHEPSLRNSGDGGERPLMDIDEARELGVSEIVNVGQGIKLKP